MNFTLERAIDILHRTPDVLMAMLSGISPDWSTGNEGAETWSPYDIVGHLIHGEKTDWIPRARIINEQNETVFEPFDRFAQFTNSQGKSLDDLLGEFAALRQQNLEALKAMEINADKLERKGRHPEFGEVTFHQLLATWVAHDLGHIAQIARVMAKGLKEDVGPWAAYLSILHR